jgi:double zinc ribbon protein
VVELLAGIVLAGSAVYFVLQPIFRASPPGDGTGEDAEGDEGEDPGDDLSARAVALRALKEIEFDRATGKLSDEDYDALKAKYTAEALAALRSAGERGAGSGLLRGTAAPRSPLPPPACSTHGPRPESDAAFCSECGRRLAAAPGYCARCGSALEREAHYCHACGARVAA